MSTDNEKVLQVCTEIAAKMKRAAIELLEAECSPEIVVELLNSTRILSHAPEYLSDRRLGSSPRACPDPLSAVEVLGEALRADSEYLWAWQCNVAMMAVDAGADPRAANIKAADLLTSLFKANPRNTIFWPSLGIDEQASDDA